MILFTVRSIAERFATFVDWFKCIGGSIARLVKFQSSGNFNVFSPNGRFFSE